MKRDGLGALLRLLCMLTFACLLFSGAQRLIGTGEEAAPLPPTVHKEILCAAPSEEPVQTAAQGGRQSVGVQREVRMSAEGETCRPRVCQSDANGNVLCGQRSYLRIRCLTFPPGDGFA